MNQLKQAQHIVIVKGKYREYIKVSMLSLLEISNLSNMSIDRPTPADCSANSSIDNPLVMANFLGNWLTMGRQLELSGNWVSVDLY